MHPLTCLGPPGLATKSKRFVEKAPRAYLPDDTHKHGKEGGCVALSNYPHPRHSGVSAWGKLDGLVGGGWISGRSGN